MLMSSISIPSSLSPEHNLLRFFLELTFEYIHCSFSTDTDSGTVHVQERSFGKYDPS